MTIEYMCCNDAIIRLAVVGSFPIYGCRFIILRKKKKRVIRWIFARHLTINEVAGFFKRGSKRRLAIWRERSSH